MRLWANMDQRDRFPGRLTYPSEGEYDIDPESILESLEQGKTDVFDPVISTPEFNAYLPTGSYPWNQSDYLMVVSALNQFVWKESLEEWRLYSLDFYRGCQDDPRGFDSGSFIYFKNSSSLDYSVRKYEVYPIGGMEGGVSWGAGKFPRSLFGWKSIDLARLELSADDVLQLAEEHGGKEVRQISTNACTIYVSLTPNGDNVGDNKDWVTTYYSDDGYVLFKITVDPMNGRHTIHVNE